MLSIVKSPPLVSLIGNPVRFSIETDNNIDTPAIQTELMLYFTDKAPEDSRLHLLWGSVDISFSFQPSPDNTGTELPDGTNAVTLEGWISLVAAAMRLNYYIDRDWTIETFSNSLKMSGKEGNISSPSMYATWRGDGDKPTAEITIGKTSQPKIFYKLGLQLQIKDGAAWVTIGEDLSPVNTLNQAWFDIHSLFADYIYPEFLWPEITSLYFMDLRSHSVAEYRIQYFEQYGSPITPGSLAQSSSFYAMVGGVSKLQEAIYNRQGSSFWEKLTYNMYFLTWQPKTKRVSINQVEKLFFLAQTEMTRISYRINFYYLDGTSQLSQAFSAIDLPPDKGVIELTVSPSIIDGAATKPEQIHYYQVWLEYQATRISEIRTYYIDYTNYENARHFLFLNSLGGYDTLRTTGNQEDTLEYDRVSISRILSADFTEMDHENAAGSVSESMVYKANTGWRTREEISWLRDFFLSKQIFLLNVNKLVPVVVTTTQARHRIDKEDLYFLEFEYRRSFTSQYYSREIVTAQFGDDFNDDFPNE